MSDLAHILNATAHAFNQSQKDSHGDMTATPEGIASKESIFGISRPYSFYRGFAIVLAGESTDAPHEFEEVLKTFGIDEKQYDAAKTSASSWLDTNITQAINIMTRITKTAGIAPLPVKKSVMEPEPQKVWHKEPAPKLTPAFSERRLPAHEKALITKLSTSDLAGNFALIIDTVAKAYSIYNGVQIGQKDIMSHSKMEIFVKPRQVVEYLSLKCMPVSAFSINDFAINYMKRDYSTVYTGFQNCSELVEQSDFGTLAVLADAAYILELPKSMRDFLKAGGMARFAEWENMPQNEDAAKIPGAAPTSQPA